jgi:hypothetical protein
MVGGTGEEDAPSRVGDPVAAAPAAANVAMMILY